MQVPWQQIFNDKSSDSDRHWCSAGKRVCNNNHLLAASEHRRLVWVQFIWQPQHEVMELQLPAISLSVTVAWTNQRLLPSAFSLWTASQSTSHVMSCWALRPHSDPGMSERGSRLDSSSVHSSCPLMFDSADRPEEGSTRKSVWVRRFLQSKTLLCFLYFLCFATFSRHQESQQCAWHPES